MSGTTILSGKSEEPKNTNKRHRKKERRKSKTRDDLELGNHYAYYRRRCRNTGKPPPPNPKCYKDHTDYDYCNIRWPALVDIVVRDSWGARPATSEKKLKMPVERVLVLYTGTDACFTRQQCVAAMKKLQDHFMDEKGLPDIPYNFLIGTDGVVYEGRGWKLVPSKVNKLYSTRKYEGKSIDLAFIGPYFKDKHNKNDLRSYWPKESFVKPMREATYNLLSWGLNRNYLTYDFGLKSEIGC